ncbi:MAG: PepSY-like domain-containing protein [Muribaculaceae bacterium]|nr:PepSY-like domain-containing protein [Muribaculaceae bacterium]
MKNFLRFLPLFLVGIFTFTLTSCSDDDSDEPLNPEDLPATAYNFISEYFPAERIISVATDDEDYEVTLSDATQIEFDKTGMWKEVDAPDFMTIPSGFYPEKIDSYIEANYAGDGINEISKDSNGYYNVELVSGRDMKFSLQGSYIGRSI